MYDVIVVGARCAGAPTAMLLAWRGYRVLLADRAAFPSDTLSTHLIKPPGVAMLRRWGLLGQVTTSGCPPVTSFRFDYGSVVLAGSPPPLGGDAECYAPRRMVLDAILVEAAAQAGAEVRPAFTVDAVLTDDGGRVAGIRGHARGGATVKERACLVIGADGRRSLVARAVAAPAYHARSALTCAYYSYWSDVPAEQVIEGHFLPWRVILVFPTNDGQVCAFLQWPRAEFRSVRADVEGQVWAAVAQVPHLAERLQDGRRAARIAGTGDLPNFFRTPYGPGWTPVGDAGYHRDPLTAQGISDAFRDAQLLSEAIDAGLAGRQPLAEAPAGYQLLRDEAATAMYELTCQRAALEPPTPQMSQLLAALHGNQDDTDQFIGVVAGTVPIPEFFATGNIQRILDTGRKPAAHGHQAGGSPISPLPSPSPPATGADPGPASGQDPNIVYALGSSPGESARLHRQADELAADSRDLLERAGLRPGQAVIDLGCGPRGILDMLAGRVAPAGRVVGLDADPAHTAIAAEFAAGRVLRSVEIITADARRTGLPSGSFDLVHARMLLVNLPDPADVAVEMVRLARPGGQVASMEPDTEHSRCYPPHPAFERLCDIFTVAFRRNGADPWIGRRVPELFRQAGLEDIQVEARVQMYQPGNSRRTVRPDLVRAMRPQVLEMGLASTAELDELDTAARAHLEDPHTVVISGLLFLTWGRKPDRRRS